MIIFYNCIYILYVSTRNDLYLWYGRVWTRAGWRLTRARLRAARGHLPVARECSIHRLINLVDTGMTIVNALSSWLIPSLVFK
jgi:hypothetical protein